MHSVESIILNDVHSRRKTLWKINLVFSSSQIELHLSNIATKKRSCSICSFLCAHISLIEQFVRAIDSTVDRTMYCYEKFDIKYSSARFDDNL